MQTTIHVYEIRPRKNKRGVDLISDALPFGGLWYSEPDDAIDYAKFRSRSDDAVIRVYDDAGNVIETHDPRAHWRFQRAVSDQMFATTRVSRPSESERCYA